MNKILFFVAASVLSLSAFSQNYYGLAPTTNSLYEFDLTNGFSGFTGVSLEYTDGTIAGYNGMAINPDNGEIYVLAKISGSERFIGTLDIPTSEVTFLHDLDDRYAGITFSQSGDCYLITGDGGEEPSSLFEIDLITGVQTQLIDLSSEGSDGESIAFNFSDGLIYRYAGEDQNTELGVLQTIDPNTLQTNVIMMSAAPSNFGHALYYEAGNNTFTLVAGDAIHSVTTSGNVTNTELAEIGESDGLKGLILDPEFVSVEEVFSYSFTLFPNPSSGEVTITGTDGFKSLTVHSLVGREVLALNQFQSNEVRLELNSGSYIITLETADGQLKTEQLLVY